MEQNQKPKKEEWKEVSPNVWKPNTEGDNISGKLINEEAKTEGLSARYFLQTETGENIMVWGSTVLDDRMAAVQVGQTVRITYKGTVPNKRGQATKIFKVEVKA